MKYTLLSLSLIMFSVGAFAQKFVLSGTVDGVKNDSLVIEYNIYVPDKVVITRTIPVRNGKFKFKAKLDVSTTGWMKLKSRPGMPDAYFPFVPGEEAIFSGKMSYSRFRLDGTQFYKDHQRNNDFMDSLYAPYDSLKAEKDRLEEMGLTQNQIDSIVAPKSKALKERTFDLFFAYLKEHAHEDASASLVNFGGPLMVDSIVGMLAPEVRNGRMKESIERSLRTVEQLKKERAARNAVGNDTVGVGQMAPELGLKDINGNILKLASLRGKYVILDFWGSWCTWCIKGFPELKKYYSKHRAKIEIVGIACNDGLDAWKASVKKHKLPWLQVFSEDGMTEKRFNVHGFPTKVLISPDGEIISSDLGEDEDFYKNLDDLLSK